jgi:uncharacterized cupredoxin-like copper-binding protein
MNFRRLFVPLALVIAIPLLAGCGGDAEPTPTPLGPLPTRVQIELSEWALGQNFTQSGSGTTIFHVTNKGSLAHELVVLRTDMTIGDLPIGSDGKVDESAGQVIGEIEVDELQPGAEASATFQLGSGKYVLLCNLPGHYAQGMRSAFTLAIN